MVSIGIDVSKEKSTVAAIDENGEILMNPREFEHDKPEVHNLIQQIALLPEPKRVVLENTGYYHWPVVNELLEAGFFVSIVNPLVMSKYSKLQIRPGKTDKLDAMLISRFGLAYWSSLVKCSPAEENRQMLQMYSREYTHAMEMVIAQKVHFTCLLDKVLPGIKKMLCDQSGRSKLSDFVLEFWHFEKINRLTKEAFIEKYRAWVKKKGYRMNESKAAAIYNLSQNGIPTLPCSKTVKSMVTEAARVLQRLEESANLILTQMNELASTFPEFEVVSAMKGVGEKTACRLIAEIGDVRRFRSAKSLVAYAGLDAPPHQSGEFESRQRHISKRGNKHLRKVGYEIMSSLMSTKPDSDNAVYLFICKKKREGKYYLSAYMAGLNKFLHIYYARVKPVLE